MDANVIVIGIVIVYLLCMLGIGYYSTKKVETNEDFMVAGRQLGPILMAGTLAATEIGGGSSLGVVSKAMDQWGIGASWYVITMGIAFVILSFLAPKFRKAEVKTVPEYFRRRYGKSAGIITAIIMMLPLIGLTASQFIASASILKVMLNVDPKIAITIVAIVVTIYAVMGGLWAVALTDFVQVFLIVIGMALTIPFAISYAGGFGNVVANVNPDTWNMFKGIEIHTIIGLIIMYIASFTVGQEAVARYYAAKNPRVAVQGSMLSAGINFIYAFIPTILGIITLALLNMGKITDQILVDGPNYALPHLAMTVMPPVIVGLLFSGIISATMSSADSDLLGAGSIFSNDIWKIYIRPHATSKEVMLVTKITMCIIGFLGWVIAMTNTKNIINLLMFSFTLRAAGAFFPYVFGLYWKKSSLIGTVLSLVIGSLTVFLLEHKIIVAPIDPIIPGLVVSLIVFVGATLIWPSKRENCDLIPEEEN